MVRWFDETEVPGEEELPHGGVVMYCTPWCPDCRRAREWLARNGIAYSEVDISTSAAAAYQVRRWAGGNLTTPTFDIDGQIVVDFNLPELKRILKI